MRQFNHNALYIFTSLCAGILAVFVRTQRITGGHLSQDAPTSFVPMPDSLQSSPAVSVLDPRVDVEHDVSHEPVPEDQLVPDEEGASVVSDADMSSEPPSSSGDQQQNGSDGQSNAHGIEPR